MVETTIRGTVNIYPQLDNLMQFKKKDINKIKDYFLAEIHKRESTSKSVSKHIGFWSCKVFKSNENRKKHATKKFLLAKGKLNSKEKIKSKVLIDTEISHEGFTIIKN